MCVNVAVMGTLYHGAISLCFLNVCECWSDGTLYHGATSLCFLNAFECCSDGTLYHGATSLCFLNVCECCCDTHNAAVGSLASFALMMNRGNRMEKMQPLEIKH